MSWWCNGNVAAIDGSNGILKVGVEFAVESYLGGKGVNARQLDKHGVDRWLGQRLDHLAEIAGNVVSLHHIQIMITYREMVSFDH